MRASLDTNVIIHFYRAGLQDILFEFFSDGVFIYDQIRSVELERHGQDIIRLVDADIEKGKIRKYTMDMLMQLHVHKIFENNVKKNSLYYCSGDMGEVYAISLAQTLGAYSLVTDDTKQGGPYMSLLQFDDDIMPFNFADVLILRYLVGAADASETVSNFNAINIKSALNWSFDSQVKRFIRRFWKEPYRNGDEAWMKKLVEDNHIAVKSRFTELQRMI